MQARLTLNVQSGLLPGRPDVGLLDGTTLSHRHCHSHSQNSYLGCEVHSRPPAQLRNKRPKATNPPILSAQPSSEMSPAASRVPISSSRERLGGGANE